MFFRVTFHTRQDGSLFCQMQNGFEVRINGKRFIFSGDKLHDINCPRWRDTKEDATEYAYTHQHDIYCDEMERAKANYVKSAEAVRALK